MRTFLFALCGIAALAGAAGAATITVPGDQPSIAAGLAAASAGDTVLVDCGVYHEHDLALKSGVVLISETGGAYCTVIDADGLGRVLTAQGVNNQARVEGFTLRGGSVPGALDGGGIYLDASSPVFESCIITDNETQDGDGGGMACNTASAPVFDRCTFSWNRSGGDGGGIHLDASSPQFVDCAIMHNETSFNGGGIHAQQSGFNLQHSDIYENNAGGDGGGLFLGVASTATCELATFYGNRAGTRGGGLVVSASTPVFTGCTIAENSAFSQGAGIVVMDGADAEFHQVIVAYNTLSEAVAVLSGNANFVCSDIYGNPRGNWTAPIDVQLGQSGNLMANPEFCGVDSSANYYLQMDSPCAPQSNNCGVLIGSRIIDCGIIAVDPTSFSAVKSYY